MQPETIEAIENIEEVKEELTVFGKFISELPQKALNLGIRILLVAIFFLIGMKLINLIRKIIRRSLTKAKVETGAIQFLDGLIKAVLYFILIMSIATKLGVDATSVVALLGSAGVAVGLAIQGSLSNLAGGVLLLLLRPFRVGDYIIEDSKGNEGRVIEIGIFYTKLRTVDHKIVILPNGTLANNSMTNFSESELRRVNLTVGISYNADMEKAKDVLLNVLKEDPDVNKNEELIVFVDSLGSSEVILGLRCYCDNPLYWQVRWRLTENIKLALDDAGIEIPYQQVSVHVDNVNN